MAPPDGATNRTVRRSLRMLLRETAKRSNASRARTPVQRYRRANHGMLFQQIDTAPGTGEQQT